jgi:tRNA pseudouridine55 synthase
MTSGFLVVDKPAGITSHDVVGVVRAVTGIKRIGHTGTLDPFATGVLALAIGTSTRLIQYLDESAKVYDATLQLGAATDTGDPTGEVVAEAPVPELDRALVERALAGLIGSHMQRPPAYSAVKVAGRPLYDYARRGEVVEAPARPIHIDALELVSLEPGRLRVVMRCSRGTYARVVAEELAAALGTVGHLVELRRLRSGPFYLEGALDFDALAAMVGEEAGRPWPEILMPRRSGLTERARWRSREAVVAALGPRLWSPIAALAQLPVLETDAAEAAGVRFGRAPSRVPAGVAPGGRYVVAGGGQLLAVGELTARGPGVICVLEAA